MTARTKADSSVGQPPLPTGYFVDVPGRGKIYVRRMASTRQDAPTILLLHGWTVTAAMWWKAFEPLSHRFNVVAMDIRGHGRGSATVVADTVLEDAAKDGWALLDTLGVGKATVVGYSMGGALALLMARQQPRRVSLLVMCPTADRLDAIPLSATSPRWMAQRTLASLRTVRAHSRPSAWPALAEMLTDFQRNFRPRNWGRMVAFGRAIGHFNASTWSGQLNVPAVQIITDKDELVPRQRQIDTAKRLKARTVHVDGDHLVVALAPERFIPALLDACLNGVQGRGPRTFAA